MMTTNPAAQRYLERLGDELVSIPDTERAAIIREIEDHVADAVGAGKSLDVTLTSLGPADALARAFAVELALNPRGRTLGPIDRSLTVIGLLAVASLPSFIISVVLASIGVAFVASGIAVFAGGIGALINPAWVPDLTVSPWLCLLIGPPLLAVGAASLAALFYYARFIIGLTKKTLARVRQRT